MANNTYIIDERTAVNGIVTIDDTGGTDWLVYDGTYPALSEIFLNWVVNGSSTISGYGQYIIGQSGRALTVNGIIENARGGNGVDRITGNDFANIIYGDKLANGSGGNDTIDGMGGIDRIFGGAGSDNLSGGAGGDRLFGGAGADVIYGNEMDSTIGGADTIQGGLGADTILGSYDNATVDYSVSAAAVTVVVDYFRHTIGRGGEAAGDDITGIANIIGSAHDDILTGRYTGATDDPEYLKINRFSGGAGRDLLTMGAGADRADGGTGVDTLLGQAGNDTLVGGTAGDFLTGGLGADRLSGGAGADRFIIAVRGDSTVAVTSRDTIGDFHHAEADKIDLRALDAIPGGANSAFTFIGRAAFSGQAGQLRIVNSGDGVIVQGTLNADRTADFAIFVDDVATLLRGDFLL